MAPTHPAALDQRLLELELQLMTRDSRAATGLASAAVRLGQDLARRLHHRRAARAFRIATEAAMRAPEIGPPSELARLAAHALEGIDPAFIGRSFHLLTAARALSHDLRLAEAEVRHAAVRDALLVAALRIVDPEVRERWLAHPDQRALAAVSGADPAGGSPVFLPLRA